MIHTWRSNGNDNYKKAHKSDGFLGLRKKWASWRMFSELGDNTLTGGCNTLYGSSGRGFLGGDRTTFKEYVLVKGDHSSQIYGLLRMRLHPLPPTIGNGIFQRCDFVA